MEWRVRLVSNRGTLVTHRRALKDFVVHKGRVYERQNVNEAMKIATYIHVEIDLTETPCKKRRK